MKPLRVIDTDLAEPAYTAALDSAILLARGKGLVPDTLHIYRRSWPTISVGFFQDVKATVDVELASDLGVRIIRRASGGSSIYTDSGQFIFALHLSAEDVPESPAESYPLLCEGVVRALAMLGIDARWKALNDVTVNGRKISGSAQTRKHGAVLHHGTLLVDTDLELMSRLLRPKEGREKRGAEGMTTVRRELGRDVPMDVVKEALIQGFSRTLDRAPVRGCLTKMENDETKGFLKGAYCSP